MHKFVLAAASAAALLTALAGLARAWWVKGHESITEAAAMRLPDDVPAFFRAEGKALAHFAGDPDRWKNKAAAFSQPGEGPNHFLGTEDLDGKPLPRDRFKGLEQIFQSGRQPSEVGLLPYALCEGADKLACAFYDFRADRDNPAVRWKCLVYAGNLAHYTTDAAMPLHTTRDYDGRRVNGRMVQKGIHAKLDGFPEKFGLKPEEICRGLEVRPIDDLREHVKRFIEESHTHIDKAYQLDAAGAFETPTEENRAFVLERCRAGAQLTMDVWHHAWVRSAKFPPHY